MTIQYRFGFKSQENPYPWSDLELGYLDNKRFCNGHDFIEFREKPSFEPGYFLDALNYDPVFPPLVKWFDTQPSFGWERVTVVNHHLD